MRTDNDISTLSRLEARVKKLVERNKAEGVKPPVDGQQISAKIAATGKQLAELLQAMADRSWDTAVALVQEAPELLLRKETLAHPELSNASAPLLELVFASAPSTCQRLAADQAASVGQTLAQAGSVLGTVELGRQPLREEDVESLARVACEKDLRVRLAGAVLSSVDMPRYSYAQTGLAAAMPVDLTELHPCAAVAGLVGTAARR
jgi:hypothetical protein